MARESFVIAVDLGGTNLRFALLNAAGDIVHRQSEATAPGHGRDTLVQRLANGIMAIPQRAGIAADHIAAVGLGIPGLVELQPGRVVKAPNIPALDGFLLGPALESLLPWPVVLDNDANLFVWGEAYLGAGQGEPNLLGITLGTGVGGGLVLDGRLWHGSGGTAAEIGHMTIEPDGERCNCGNTGCLETLASATWTVKWLLARLEEGAPSSLAPLWRQSPQELTARRLSEAAAAGDALAQQALARVGRALGIAIANVVHLLGIPTVILGGNFANAWEQFIPALEEELSRRLTFFPRQALRLRPASLGDNAGLVGAARLAREVSRAPGAR